MLLTKVTSAVTSNKQTLDFYLDNNFLVDSNTNSKWNLLGKCLSGELRGTQLKQIQAYQEIWQPWKFLHPDSEPY